MLLVVVLYSNSPVPDHDPTPPPATEHHQQLNSASPPAKASTVEDAPQPTDAFTVSDEDFHPSSGAELLINQ